MLFLDWKGWSFEILTVQMDLTPSATGHTACCWCPAAKRHQFIPNHQADSSLKMINDQLYMMFLPRYSHEYTSAHIYMVNQDRLIRLSLIYRYIRLTCGSSFSSTIHDYIFWRCELLWYRLPSATMVDAVVLVPHRYQFISTSRFTRFTNAVIHLLDICSTTSVIWFPEKREIRWFTDIVMI